MEWQWPWTRRIRVNKPIDWANTWSLEEQARGISFEMDDQKNLKAVPVVMIDTTKPSVVPAVPSNVLLWYEYVALPGGGGVVIHTPPVGMRSYIQTLKVDYSDAAIAIPQTLHAAFLDGIRYLFRQYWWCDATASFRQPFVIDFGQKALPVTGALTAYLDTALTSGTVLFSAWGFDQ